MYLRHIFIFLLIIFVSQLHSQEVINPCQHLNQLQNGTLLLRLESNQKKIALMESLLQNASESPLKEKTREDLQELKSITNKNNKLLIKHFKEKYQFSKVLFIYDADYKKLIEGNDYSQFLNETLQKQKDEFDFENTYLCKIGTTQVNRGSSTKSLIIATIDGNDLEKPFPNTLKYEGGFFEALFSAEMQEEKRAIRLATKLQQKFEKYQARCFAKGFQKA